MSLLSSQHLSPASPPAALPCALIATERITRRAVERYTPDAILDCSASDPQSKYWRGPGRTTTRR